MFNSIELAAMQASLRATQLQQQVTLQNLANYETPDYKAKEVSFGEVYANALKDGGDGKYRYTAKITEQTGTEIRTDGNNVDIEKESNALLDAQYQYSTMIDYLNSRYSMIRTAIGK